MSNTPRDSPAARVGPSPLGGPDEPGRDALGRLESQVVPREDLRKTVPTAEPLAESSDAKKTVPNPDVVAAARRSSQSLPAAMLRGQRSEAESLALVGALDRVPVLAIDVDVLPRLGLDHHMGFMLTLVDGQLSLETILDVCAMPRQHALHVLAELVTRKVIRVG